VGCSRLRVATVVSRVGMVVIFMGVGVIKVDTSWMLSNNQP
jgi:hypothetical protein